MNVSNTVREKQLNVRLSPEEAERLKLLEEHYGLNGANTVRLLIAQAAKNLEAAAPAARKPRKR